MDGNKIEEGKRPLVVIHYSEIGLKGKNRSFFEERLIENIKRSLGIKRVYRRYGRIVCELEKEKNLHDTKLQLSKIPGISRFMFASRVSLDIEEIKREVFRVLKDKDFKTFRITTSRSNKRFQKTSQEVNEIVGEYIVSKLNKRVKLRDPDVEVYIEICEKEAFVGSEKVRGIGGLPTGSSGKLVCSLSGGIDSPVASFLMIKRGCEIIFVHIYNSTQTSKALLGKIEDIVKKLTEYQLSSKLYIIPFEELQKQIIAKIPSKYRMIVYRRFMFRIINEICKREKARGVVTGDNIGQVASQTVENLGCIYESSNFPVFTPLIGLNKEEIIDLAKRIGTYELSIRPYPDCCSFMIARHPETRAKLEDVKQLENGIENSKELIEKCISNAEIKIFDKQ